MPHSRVLITGGADGLGRELALAYIERGDDVTVMDIATDLGESLAASHGAKFVPLDLANFDPTALDLGTEPFEVVIINAGISAFGNFAEIPWEKQQAVIDINFTGHLQLLHRILGEGRLAHHGRLAFTLSAAAFTPIPVTATYSATKTALEGFGLAIEPWLMHRKISISHIYPGQMRTAHLKKYYGNEDAQAGEPPDVIAARIMRALDRRKRRIHPDGMSKIFRFIQTIAPWALPGLIYRFNRKRFAEMLYRES